MFLWWFLLQCRYMNSTWVIGGRSRGSFGFSVNKWTISKDYLCHNAFSIFSESWYCSAELRQFAIWISTHRHQTQLFPILQLKILLYQKLSLVILTQSNEGMSSVECFIDIVLDNIVMIFKLVYFNYAHQIFLNYLPIYSVYSFI